MEMPYTLCLFINIGFYHNNNQPDNDDLPKAQLHV